MYHLVDPASSVWSSVVTRGVLSGSSSSWFPFPTLTPTSTHNLFFLLSLAFLSCLWTTPRYVPLFSPLVFFAFILLKPLRRPAAAVADAFADAFVLASM